MFTGIIQALGEVRGIQSLEEHISLCIRSPFSCSLDIGCSISVEGVCLTLVNQVGTDLYFDVIPETLACTTLSERREGDKVNLERAARFGDEIGGHLISGHVLERGCIVDIKKNRYTFQVPLHLACYLFEKGFIAVDGISLTLFDVDEVTGTFSVGLIPETLRSTTLGSKCVGDHVNIEFDMMTKIQVDVLQRILAKRHQ